RKDGSEFVVDVVVSPIVYQEKLIGSVVIFRDITRQKELEYNLNKLVKTEVAKNIFKDKLLEKIFNGLHYGIFVLDKDGCFVQINDGFCKILGYLNQELIGRHFSIIFPPSSKDYAVGLQEEFVNFDLDLAIAPIDLKLISRFDDEVIVHANFARIFSDLDGCLTLCSVIDITEELQRKEKQKIQESILIQQSKMAEMGIMIDAIIHQWKQPLNAISLSIQNLALDAQDGLCALELVKCTQKDICSTVNFMSDTMDNFRKFFRIQKQSAIFDIIQAVNDVLKLLEHQLKIININIVIKKDLNNMNVLGFENEFKQVVLNILNNAKDALVSKNISDKKIEVLFQQKSNVYALIISDNAGGIQNELLSDKIFEPYFSTKGEYGTGIGLSLAKTIIEKHMNGKLFAYNSTHGACFEIALKANVQY
ncbi:MAG: hypothetical protein RL154_886, partial [Pseudomonadota bacterium]